MFALYALKLASNTQTVIIIETASNNIYVQISIYYHHIHRLPNMEYSPHGIICVYCV